MLRILIFLFLANTASAQFNLSFKERMQRNWPIYTSFFVAGAADGFEETIEHHYYIFRKKFPNANEQFWNPEESWKNKWKDGNPDLGPAYWGSTNVLVWTTDAYHIARLVKHTSYSTGTCYALYSNAWDGRWRDKPTFWDHALDFVIASACRSIGFQLVYGVAFKD